MPTTATTRGSGVTQFYRPCPGCKTPIHVRRKECPNCGRGFRHRKTAVVKRTSRPPVSPIGDVLDALRTTRAHFKGSERALNALRALQPLIEQSGGAERAIRLLEALSEK